MLHGMRICLAVVFPVVAITTLVGCQGVGGSDCEEVTIDGVTTCVDPQAGAESLANTRWELLDSSGSSILTLVFDDGGNLVEFADSDFLANLLGANIILDDAPHSTGIVEQLKYSAVAFEGVGEPVDGVREFSIQTNIEVTFDIPILPDIEVASGTANASGTIEGDIMTGEFVFAIEIDPGVQSLAEGFLPSDIPLDDLNETLSFTATRTDGS